MTRPRLTTLKPRIATSSATRVQTVSNGTWRDGKTTNERGYTYRWQQARAAFLRSNPLCVMCQADGVIAAAEVVDHIEPHRGDMARFWDEANWQPLCKRHHDAKTQTEGK